MCDLVVGEVLSVDATKFAYCDLGLRRLMFLLLKNVSSPLLGFQFSSKMSFVSLESACIFRSIDIVLENPFLSIVSVFY